MNSQQELLNAINAISESKDKSFDTPATVLRVEDDTVWVHIDGGADETPVRKTVSCEQGETVQVRISNGSAFLVGNASAPPTDDRVANVAHFVAEQADVKATSAEETAVRVSEEVSELEVEVDGKVDVGTSNITHMSSTMYQNANGVNIFNDTLEVGDSYAHIDGDSFDIKEVTTAGQIDDANDFIFASFGADETKIQSKPTGEYNNSNYLSLNSSGISIGRRSDISLYANGWDIGAGLIESFGTYNDYAQVAPGRISIGDSGTTGYNRYSRLQPGSAKFHQDIAGSANNYTEIEGSKITCQDDYNMIIGVGATRTIIQNDKIMMTGDVYDYTDGYKKTPTVFTSTELAASATSYTFYAPLSNMQLFDNDPVIDIYDTIFGFAPTGCTINGTTCTVTFPAQSSSHTIKLFVY